MISDKIKEEVMQLKDLDKIHLIELLFDTLERPSPEIELLWAKESEARFAASKAGKLQAKPFEQIVAKYR